MLPCYSESGIRLFVGRIPDKRTPFEEKEFLLNYVALEAGWEAKDLCEHLGHTSIKTTYDIYAHIMPKRKKENAKKAEAALLGH